MYCKHLINVIELINMIVRYFIKCNTCETSITLRVQLGHSENEEIKFLCLHCKENLSIGLNLDKKNISFKILPMKNCISSDIGGEYLYLSSEILTTNEIATGEMAFPSLSYMHQIDSGEIKVYLIKQKTINNWDILQKIFSQKSLKNFDLENKYLEEYRTNNKLYKDSYFKDCLFDFCISHMNSKRYDNIQNIFKKIGKLYKSNKKQEIINLRNYLRRLFRQKIPFIMESINSIYKNFDLHYPIITWILADLNNKNDLYYPFNDFSQIKLSYGDIYEKLAELLFVFAALFNISEGRSFCTFKSMDLKKYDKLDKAKKPDPFNNVQEFILFCEEYDSSLRNASHHGHIQYNKSNDSIQYYTSNINNMKDITLKEYLIKTNKIFINMLSVVSIWLFILIINE
jgi:hypothetical protein